MVTWYPITPSSSLVETLIGYMKRFRIDPETGKATYAIVQAEDELASIGMALGAGWAGARSMTATAGPGISLMSEFIGLGYYAEIPAVVFDVERVGPSTGLPTRTAQGDLLTTALLSHGDTKHPDVLPLLAAKSASRCRIEAFDFAEKFQTPVFVMTDLDLGMNNWMADAVRLSREAHRARQGADRRGSRAARRLRPLQGCGWRRRRLPHAARHQSSRTRPTSRAAAATTRRPSTPSAKTITSTTWTAWRTSSKSCASTFPQPVIQYSAKAPRSASSPSARPITRCAKAAISCSDEYDIDASYLRLQGYPFTDAPAGLHPPPRPRLCGGSEPRRASCSA